jgi:myo-inositol-1(or 4)-monophosphatase
MSAPDPAPLLELATDLSRRAGALALSMHAGLDGHDTKSTPTDVVTAADHACEQLLADGIRAARPDDGFLGEEGASSEGTSGVRWVVDPIDGTVNYLYGLPQWAVSIGVEVDGQALVGVVFDAAKDELWTAVRGEGAFLGGRRLRCTAVQELSQTLVATGFSYDARRRSVQAQHLARVLPAVRDLRRLGAGSLDLCSVAAGRVDAYYEQGLNPWDMSAGLLIAAEAGARTGDLRGGPAGYRMVVASAPAVFEPLVEVLVGLEADDDPLAQEDPLAQPGDPIAS